MRRSWMKRRRPRRLDDETPEENAYKAWLHTQPCVITGTIGETVQASHMGTGGMGQKKGSWFDAVPMRWDVHQEWGEHRGRFAGWERNDRRVFSDNLIEMMGWRYANRVIPDASM